MKTKLALLISISAIILSGCFSAVDYDGFGNIDFNGGYYDHAIKDYLIAIEKDPTYSDGYFHLGMAYYMKGNYDDALVNLKKAVESKEDFDRYYWLGSAYYKKEQYKEVVAVCQKALALIKQDSRKDFIANTYLGKAKSHDALGQYDQAIKAINQAINLEPDKSSYYVELSKFLNENKQYDKSITAAKRALELNPNESTAYNNMAFAYEKSGRYKEAVNYYKQAMAVYPDNTSAYKNLMNLYYKMHLYDEAAQITIKGLEKKPNDIYMLQYLSSAYYRTGWYNKGLSQIEKAIELSSNNAWSLSCRALIKRELGMADKAMQDALKANELDQNMRWAIGALQVDSGQYSKAVETLSKGTDVHTKILLATAYAGLGKIDDAIEVYNTIPRNEMSPKNIPLWEDRNTFMSALRPVFTGHVASAEKCRSRGDYAAALDEYAEALPIASGSDEEQGLIRDIFATVREMPNPPALPEEARRNTIRGDLLLEEGDFKGAAVEYKKAVGCAPYIARLYAQTALICEKMEDYPEAIRYMERYVQAAPDAPDARAAKDAIIKWEMIVERKDEN